MRKFEIPEMCISTFSVEDVITASIGGGMGGDNEVDERG